MAPHKKKQTITREHLLTLDKPLRGPWNGNPVGVRYREDRDRHETAISPILRDFLRRANEGPLPL